jgi:hypothetical protein
MMVYLIPERGASVTDINVTVKCLTQTDMTRMMQWFIAYLNAALIFTGVNMMIYFIRERG